ncbi:SCO family protein [Sorangium sp. So ce281]|uniref:SCO family protein n=1 Tax=unclassified Sorangium TaxID=2621164 RepID=UPI003F5D74B0
MSRPLSALLAVLALVVATVTPARIARAADTAVPPELTGADIVERPGALLPRDLKLRDQSGQEVELGRYAAGDKPLVLLLAYYECPMLCSLVLNGVLQAMKGGDWTAGKEYRALVVSFDPRDTPEAARKKRANYVEAYGRPVAGDGFDFLVGDERSVRALADAVGFGYRWDETTKQYAHAAGAFVFTPDGRLSRTLYGITFPQKNFNLALREAGSGQVGSAWDRVLLFCFHYDPNARGYVLATQRLMKASGAACVALLGLWLIRFWRMERSHIRARANKAS